jgi:hypothetical protein
MNKHMAASTRQKNQRARVQEAITNLLHENQLYAIGAYGWSGPDDVDSETVGHAMWQTDGPTDALLESGMAHGRARTPQVTKWQILCSIAGADFEGLMIAARLSIGHALYQIRTLGERLDAEDSLASVHLLSAAMTLGAASDRLRDLFIAAVFQKTSRAYDRSTGPGATERRLFDTPFREARTLGKDLPKFEDALPKLERLAMDNLPFRTARNKLVHELATELGRQRQAAIRNLNDARADSSAWEKLTDADFKAMKVQAEADDARKIAEALDPPMAWYRLLVETANEVFIVENVLRNAAARSG